MRRVVVVAWSVLALLATVLPDPRLRARSLAPASAGSSEQRTQASPGSTEELIAELGCAACHSGVPSARDPRGSSPALGPAGARYHPAYLLAYLENPTASRRSVGRARMPDFHLDERERLALALFLTADHAGDGGMPPDERGRVELIRRFERARTAHPSVTSRTGQTIFAALNCAGCHTHPVAEPWPIAPDLSAEGARVRPEWLRSFLRRPHPVRPFGFYPGSGSRMPDFRLSAAEADSISAYLLRQRRPLSSFQPRPLSVFSTAKAEALLRERLPCLGCHQLGREGGRIGPDLSGVSGRLTPSFVYTMIRDPQHAVPGTIMPKTPLTPPVLELITNYLLGRTASASTSTYLSLVDNPIALPRDDSVAPYARFCAHCHGIAGRGDGFNARFLPTPPTAHAAGAYMSKRPDGTLYDAIHAGGYVLDQSNRMPAFGQTLSRDQIWRLVRRIRELCKCEGPDWSRDPHTDE